MKYILSHWTDPALNLALEEVALNDLTSEDYLIVWVSRPAIIVGKFQNVYQEVDVRRAWQKNIPVYRRLSGGGCVYHDGGNLNFSYITGWTMEENSYSRFLEPVMDVLTAHGAAVYPDGICNICVDGKKISGNAQSIFRKRMLHHGTLLFDARLDDLASVIRPDYEHFISKAMPSAPMAVTNLRCCPGFDIETMDGLKQCLISGMGCEPADEYVLSADQVLAVRKLAEVKYRTWEWNFAKSAVFDYHNDFEGPGSHIEMKVDHGVIRELTLAHRQISREVTMAAAQMLCGKRLIYPELHAMLDLYGAYGPLLEDIIFER